MFRFYSIILQDENTLIVKVTNESVWKCLKSGATEPILKNGEAREVLEGDFCMPSKVYRIKFRNKSGEKL